MPWIWYPNQFRSHSSWNHHVMKGPNFFDFALTFLVFCDKSLPEMFLILVSISFIWILVLTLINCYFSSVILIINIFFKIKLLFNRPVAKFIEKNLALAVSVNFFKFLFRIFNWADPFFYLWQCSLKFFIIEFLIITGINFPKSH